MPTRLLTSATNLSRFLVLKTVGKSVLEYKFCIDNQKIDED